MTNIEREMMIAAGLTEEDFKPDTTAQPDEYAEYNAYCEECKAKAKK